MLVRFILLPLFLPPLVHGNVMDVVCKIPIVGHLFSCIAERVETDFLPTIYSNPYDGRAFSLMHNETLVTLYGASFKEVALPLTLVAESAEDKTTIVIGENNTISSMLVEDGNGGVAFFEFTMTNTSLEVQLNLPNEGYRGIVALDPINARNRKLTSRRQGRSRSAATKNEDVVAQLRRHPPKRRFLQPDPSTPFIPASVDIFVNQCGQNNPNLISLGVTAKTSDGEFSSVSVQEGSDGMYTAYFSVEPADPIVDEVLSSVCSTISAVAQVCPVFEALGPASVIYGEAACVAIAGAIASTGAGAPVAPLVGELCAAGVAGALVFCEAHSLAGGGLPPGAPNVMEDACAALASGSSIIEDLYFQTEVTVTAEAQLSSGEVLSGTTTFTPAPGVSGQAIQLSGSGSPQLVNFEANPPNPAAFESYRAIADVMCADAQTVVTMEVVGTDGYYDIASCSGSCFLDVEGGAGGVADTITVLIEHPSIPSPGDMEVIGLVFR